MTFILEHWLLFLALVVILVLLSMNLAKDRLLGFKEIPPGETVRLINHEDAVVVDVRDEEEFVRGHILHAINIPLAGIEGRIEALQTCHGRPVIVCCRTGQRSARACAHLKRHGLEPIFKLAGGIMAWENAGLPLASQKN